MMKLALKGVNLTLTPSLRRYVSEKLGHPISRLLGRSPAFASAVFDLELVCGTRHHRKGPIWSAAANIQLPGKHVWQRAEAEDIHAAIDELEDILKREITQYKERSRAQLLRGARRAKKEIQFDRSARLRRVGRNREEGN